MFARLKKLRQNDVTANHPSTILHAVNSFASLCGGAGFKNPELLPHCPIL